MAEIKPDTSLLKPKPREIFVVFRGNGTIASSFLDENAAKLGVLFLNRTIPMGNYYCLPFSEIVK